MFTIALILGTIGSLGLAMMCFDATVAMFAVDED